MQLTTPRALTIVRFALGAIFLVRTAPLLGWPDGKFHIALFSLPAWLVSALVILRTLGALAFMLGFRARVAGIVASVCGYLVLAQDALSYVNTLHLLFLSTFLVALADATPSGLWLVRGIPLSVYFFSGVAKLNAQFLSGSALLGFCEDGYLRAAIARFACASPSRAHDLSIAVAVVELSLPALLVYPRTRAWALVAALAFHATLEIAMRPDRFGWIMLALLVAFIPGLRRGRAQAGS
jgi:hypothetical protein